MTNRLAKWMRAEDDQLRAAAASGESIAEIVKRLCRSERGIRHRALKLGIKLHRRRIEKAHPESEPASPGAVSRANPSEA
jgi:hypothetical protein